MSANQKAAWLNLIVIALTTITVASLYAWLGRGAAGGFGILGLAAFGVVFYRQRPGKVVADERDEIIHQRATRWAFASLWIAFVTCALIAQAVFGDSVPVVVVQSSVWVAWMILFGVQAIATLVLYGRTPADA